MRVVTEADHKTEVQALRKAAASAKADAQTWAQTMIREDKKRMEQDLEATRRALEQANEGFEVERKSFARERAVLDAMLDEQLGFIRHQGGQTVACCSRDDQWREHRLAMLAQDDGVIEEALAGWILKRATGGSRLAVDPQARFTVEHHGPIIAVHEADTEAALQEAAGAAAAFAVRQGWPWDGVEIQGNPAWLHAAARAFLEAGFTLDPSLRDLEDAVREELDGESSDGGSEPAPPGSHPRGG
jgi:hypothetical protein